MAIYEAVERPNMATSISSTSSRACCGNIIWLDPEKVCYLDYDSDRARAFGPEPDINHDCRGTSADHGPCHGMCMRHVKIFLPISLK